jgi:hypothetical protein
MNSSRANKIVEIINTEVQSRIPRQTLPYGRGSDGAAILPPASGNGALLSQRLLQIGNHVFGRFNSHR